MLAIHILHNNTVIFPYRNMQGLNNQTHQIYVYTIKTTDNYLSYTPHNSQLALLFVFSFISRELSQRRNGSNLCKKLHGGSSFTNQNSKYSWSRRKYGVRVPNTTCLLYILLKSRNTRDRGTMTPELYPTIKLNGYLYKLL